MSDKRNNASVNNQNPFSEINTNRDGMMYYTPYFERSHVNASIESSGTTPIDITLMTGNGGSTEEGE